MYHPGVEFVVHHPDDTCCGVFIGGPGSGEEYLGDMNLRRRSSVS
jgi:hypothetical protein